MSTQITTLPTAYVPAGFTSALAAAVVHPTPQASAPVSVAANKSVLVSFNSTQLVNFLVEVSNNAGATWTALDSFQPHLISPPFVRMYTPNEAIQLRFTAFACGAPIPAPTVAVATLTL